MKKIALISGGYTGEAVISAKSAKTVANALANKPYEIYHIVLSADKWVCTIEGNDYVVDKNDFSLTINGAKTVFDAAFIIIHGTPGEDGKLQGYLDMLHIPYNTCNAISSALTMNKAYTKAVVAHIPELHVARSVQLFREHHKVSDIAHLQLPLFVKPNSGGSSLGMSKVKKQTEIPSALKKAFDEDEQVIVEEFIGGREFTVGVYADAKGINVLPITEIKSSKEFFDYEAKYTTGMSEEITPADLPESKRIAISKIVQQVYATLGCSGVVRIDFILLHENQNFYFLEINTIPGQSENSIIPQQVRAAGMELGNFYADIIEASLK